MRGTLIRDDTQDAILDAAERLLARYGYRKTTMDDLAREAGIGKGTIYLYFPSKEEVALSTVDRINHRLHQRLKCLAHSHESPDRRLRQMLVTRVLFRFDSVQLFNSSLEELFIDIRSGFRARRERLLREEAEILADVLVEGRIAGTFAFEDAVLTAHTLLLATAGLLPLSLGVRDLGERAEIEAQAGRVADLLLTGLYPRAAQTR